MIVTLISRKGIFFKGRSSQVVTNMECLPRVGDTIEVYSTDRSGFPEVFVTVTAVILAATLQGNMNGETKVLVVEKED